MKRTMKRITAVLLVLAAVFMCLSGCTPKEKEETSGKSGESISELMVSGLDIMHEDEFGGVYIKITIDDFNAYGFEYGDSLNVSFSNGHMLAGIPYYNGYYTNNGEPLLVAYPGYPYIKACFNNGGDLWNVAALSEEDTADISLAEKGVYLDIQDARNISYQDEREQFPSDEAFANFRNVQMGNLKEGMLYRSASPCDNQHNRAPYVDRLAAASGVNCIVNLADTEEKISNFIAKDDFDSPYFKSVYDRGNVILLKLNMNYGSDDFRTKLVNGLTAMAEHEGPYLVHCTEGKDRTGFVCILLEALCGCSYQEIADDYMITYDNYYKINPESEPGRYDVILESVFLPMLESIVGDGAVDLAAADLAVYADRYLVNAGMSPDAVEALRGKLTK